MNGIHDLGGLTGFGPIRQEIDEAVFHAEWERRVFALNMASLAFLGPVDRARHAIERMNSFEYLATSYYEHWIAAIVTMATDLGYLTDLEIETGRVARTRQATHPAPSAEVIEGLVRGGMPANRDEVRTQPAFGPGATVRARHLEIAGHTRLARYVQGRMGVVSKRCGFRERGTPRTAGHHRNVRRMRIAAQER